MSKIKELADRGKKINDYVSRSCATDLEKQIISEMLVEFTAEIVLLVANAGIGADE